MLNTHNCLLTYSGHYVNVVDPDVDTINIVDIAHALSQINRFGGHTRTPYTVAQHSVLVSQIVPIEYRLAALLHDAAEAYFGDMVYPIKYLPEIMQKYRDLEGGMQAAIFQRFGLPMAQSDECRAAIHEADLILLASERRDLMSPDRTPWPILHDIKPLAFRIRPLLSLSAEAEFLSRFKSLSGFH